LDTYDTERLAKESKDGVESFDYEKHVAQPAREMAIDESNIQEAIEADTAARKKGGTETEKEVSDRNDNDDNGDSSDTRQRRPLRRSS
jgi:hypothetical protein